MRIKKVAVGNSLSNNPSNETEVTEMIRVDATVWVWLEGASVFCRSEQCIVGIKYLFGQYPKKFSRKSTGINAFLVAECYMKAPAHFIGITKPKLVVCIFEHMPAPNMKPKTSMPTTGVLPQSTNLSLEPVTLYVKVE